MPTADIAMITRMPTFTSATNRYWLNGSTANEVSAVNVEMTGAIQKIELVGVGGDDVFLEQQLEGVGDGLQQAVRADAHGAEADLEIGQHFALDQRDVAGHQRKDRDDHDGDRDRDEEGFAGRSA